MTIEVRVSGQPCSQKDRCGNGTQGIKACHGSTPYLPRRGLFIRDSHRSPCYKKEPPDEASSGGQVLGVYLINHGKTFVTPTPLPLPMLRTWPVVAAIPAGPAAAAADKPWD